MMFKISEKFGRNEESGVYLYTGFFSRSAKTFKINMPAGAVSLVC